MAKFLDIKMATVTEEDFENEQHNVRANTFYLEDSEVDLDNDERMCSNVEVKPSHILDDKDYDKRDSLIEKDADSILDSDVILSVCQKFPFRSEAPPSTCSPSTTVSSIPSGLKKSSRLPKATSSPSPLPTEEPFSYPQTTTTPSPAVTSRLKNKTFTLSIKDKFVTELCFYHPLSFLKNRMINLGIFLATSRTFGDHFVYKMSPLSPFKILCLQPQDKITKINGFDISCWSHNTVVNFVRHATHNDPNRFVGQGKTYKFTFSLEYIPVNRPTVSPEQGPTRLLASLEIIMQMNGRITIASSSISPSQVVSYLSNSCKLLKVKNSDFIKVEEMPTGGNSSNDEPPLRVIVGERESGENGANLIFHKFEMETLATGEVFAFETFRPGTFLHAGANVAGSNISVITQMNNTDIQDMTTSDNRLFRIFSDHADDRRKIIHIQSGLYLKADYSAVSLQHAPYTFPSSMYFQHFNCT